MTLYDLIFPPMCPYCGELTGDVRESCERCAKLLEAEPHKTPLDCGAVCWSVFIYGDSTQKAILDYKYRRRKQSGKSFALTLTRIIEEYIGRDNIDLITGVPAKKDYSGSRFDQVMFLMKRLTKITGIPNRQTLMLTRKKQFQHSLNKNERRENVKGLFRVTLPDDVKDKRILLIDDVVTTGATLDSCAEELLNSGAKSVVCLTLAW